MQALATKSMPETSLTPRERQLWNQLRADCCRHATDQEVLSGVCAGNDNHWHARGCPFAKGEVYPLIEAARLRLPALLAVMRAALGANDSLRTALEAPGS